MEINAPDGAMICHLRATPGCSFVLLSDNEGGAHPDPPKGRGPCSFVLLSHVFLSFCLMSFCPSVSCLSVLLSFCLMSFCPSVSCLSVLLSHVFLSFCLMSFVLLSHVFLSFCLKKSFFLILKNIKISLLVFSVTLRSITFATDKEHQLRLKK